jgi:acyl carrier protein
MNDNSSPAFRGTTYETITEILVTKFQVERAAIKPETLLTELGLDSLSLMEFVFAVEDAMNLRIPEDKLDPRQAGIDLKKLATVIDEFIQTPKK